METRAPYTLVGTFVLAAIAAVFGFVFWLNNTGGLGERAVYRVQFENTVSGLLTGAAVLFNGIRVGEVTDLQLNPVKPRQVIATIAVAAATPIGSDTQAGLEFQGLTGVPVISLQGGASGAKLTSSSRSEPPVIVADPNAGQSMTEAARQALHRIDLMLADNSDPLKSAIGNLNTFAAALARNSDRVDGILAGLERMTGGAAKAFPVAYDITAPRMFPRSDKVAKSQLVVPEPTAVLTLDTQKIAIRTAAGEGPSVDDERWSDNVPKMLQAKIIQSFENSETMRAVARPMEGLIADYQLLIDIRSFQVAGAETAVAHVEFGAKILSDKGRIIASRTFEATAPTTDATTPASVAALNSAFRKVATDLVIWTAGLI